MELINLYKLLPALLLALFCLMFVYRVSIDVYESLTGVPVFCAPPHPRFTRLENVVIFSLFGLLCGMSIALMTLHLGLFYVVFLVLFLFGGVVVGWLCHMFMLLNRLEDEREKLIMIHGDANFLKK